MVSRKEVRRSWLRDKSLQIWSELVERAQKEELVAALNEKLGNTGVIVVAHYAGLTVADMTALRSQLREVGGSMQVAKNRLVKLALKDTDAQDLSDLFSGPTCIMTSDDPVSAPKVAAKFAKENEKLVLLGGAMGSTILDQAGVNSLAELPSLDELRGKLVGLFQAPAGNVARVLNAPGGQLARVMGAKAASE